MTLESGRRTAADVGLVDRAVYTDPEIFARERALIFARTWHYACTVRDLQKPGDFFNVSVAGQPIMIVRGDDGELRAFYNSCTHRGATLTGSPCGNTGRVFKCMYHAWSFDLTGQLMAVPYRDAYGAEFNTEDYNLVRVSCDSFYDLVFVAIDPLVPTLLEYLGAAAEHLARYVDGIEPIGRNSWIMDGNWKLWHENFRDNYHPPFVHRQIKDMIPMSGDRGNNFGFHQGHSMLQFEGPTKADERQLTKYAKSIKRYAGVEMDVATLRPKGYDLDRPTDGQEVLAIFPNLDVQPGPKGTGNEMRSGFIQTVTPLSSDKARVDITIYSSIDDTPEERREVLENLADSQGSWGKLSVDDTEAALRCQTGLYAQGTRLSLFTRGQGHDGEDSGGEGSAGRDEYSQREFYRAYAHYLETPQFGTEGGR